MFWALAEVRAAPREGAVDVTDDGIQIKRARRASGAVGGGGGGGKKVAICEDGSLVEEGIDVD